MKRNRPAPVLSRPIAVTALSCVLIAALPAIAPAQPDAQPSLTTFGLPGLIEMPSAARLPDAQLVTTLSHMPGITRMTLAFQITPRLTGAFRYSIHLGPGVENYDRSFDLRYRILDEGRYMPAVSVGMRDFVGNAQYSSEYLVASKALTPTLSASAGIGWGRMATQGAFRNPLSLIDPSFETRTPDTGLGGLPGFGHAFRGPAALFGGLEWRPNDKLTLSVEYSSDGYTTGTNSALLTPRIPYNFSLKYNFDNGVSLAASYLYGTTYGVQLSYSLNPKSPRFPSGREAAPPAVRVRADPQAAASWGADSQPAAATGDDLRRAVAGILAAQGLELESYRLSDTAIVLRLRNDRYDAAPEAIGRAARALTAVLPASVETLTIVPIVHGLPISATTVRRSDLERLEYAANGTELSWQRARISDAFSQPQGDIGSFGLYPRFKYRFQGYFTPSLFDPDAPLRADFGIQLTASYEPRPGLVFSGALRKPLIGNLDQVTRVSTSVLPHVRSDGGLYDKFSDLEIPYLTAEYFFRPGPDLYGRITAGYLERMYGGVSAELLWAPIDSRLALGMELNYARQRDFDVLFGFQDYGIVTGHASAYYDFNNGYRAQLDVGRYLAGDWGATLSLDRTFANGWRVGAFMTLTDVPFSEFGEGSFDKGIRITMPHSWLTGDPSRDGFSTTIRPVQRDGGARLAVRNRLFDLTEGYRKNALSDSWGRFWR